MNRDKQSVIAVVEGGKDDRISDLPRNVIDHILELLPIHDAGRTCVLSKRWRYIWTMIPNLVFDCCSDSSTFKEAIDKILLLHMGNIVKFVLDVGKVGLVSYPDIDIDRWVLYVTRSGVKKLTLRFSHSRTNAYKLPHCIFNCSTLTHLYLFGCVFKPPTSFLGFQNLVTLHLNWTTIAPTSEFCVIKAPLLAELVLNYCDGMQYLNIISSVLKSLHVYSKDYLVLNCFMNCTNLRALGLEFDNLVDVSNHYKKAKLEKLLASSPELDELHFSSLVLELLSADVVPTGLPFMFDCLRYLSLIVDFSKLGQTSYALRLIKSLPSLSKLSIWVDKAKGNGAEAVAKYLDTPEYLERPLIKVKNVAIKYFTSSKAEVLFVKQLLSRTPSLLRMCIEQDKDIGTSTQDILLGLIRFPRASPKAELFYLPCSD